MASLVHSLIKKFVKRSKLESFTDQKDGSLDGDKLANMDVAEKQKATEQIDIGTRAKEILLSGNVPESDRLMWRNKCCSFTSLRRNTFKIIFHGKIKFWRMHSTSRQAPSFSIIDSYFTICFANIERFETPCCSTLLDRRYAGRDMRHVIGCEINGENTWLRKFLKNG